MRKNTIYNITGCIVALIAGAWTQTAKAGYTDPQIIQSYWGANYRLIPVIFDELLPKADDLHLLGESIPEVFRIANRPLYKLRTPWGHDANFNTMVELKKLRVYMSPYPNPWAGSDVQGVVLSFAELRRVEANMMPKVRRILQTLGSREFLEMILDKQTVDAVCDRAVYGRYKTEILFRPCSFFGNFFSPEGNGVIVMNIEQGNTRLLKGEFHFKEEKNGDISLSSCHVKYRNRVGHFFSKVEW
jgi:hypothetical protein